MRKTPPSATTKPTIMPQVALLAHDQGTASAGGAGIRPTACAGAGAHVESTRCRRVRVSPAVHAVARCCSPHRRRILARGAVCTKFEIVSAYTATYTREILASIATQGRTNSIFVFARIVRCTGNSVRATASNIAHTTALRDDNWILFVKRQMAKP